MIGEIPSVGLVDSKRTVVDEVVDVEAVEDEDVVWLPWIQKL